MRMMLAALLLILSSVSLTAHAQTAEQIMQDPQFQKDMQVCIKSIEQKLKDKTKQEVDMVLHQMVFQCMQEKGHALGAR